MSRVRLSEKTPMHLWLSRIIDDLNPDDFSVKELIDEFGAEIFSPQEKLSYNGEKHIRAVVSALDRNEYIEKMAKGRFSVTDKGRKYRDQDFDYDES